MIDLRLVESESYPGERELLAEIARLERSITLLGWMLRFGKYSMLAAVIAGLIAGIVTRKFALGCFAYTGVLLPYLLLSFVELAFHGRLSRWERIPRNVGRP